MEDIHQLYQAGLMTFHMRTFWLNCRSSSHAKSIITSALKHRSALLVPDSHRCKYPQNGLWSAAIPRVDPAAGSSSWGISILHQILSRCSLFFLISLLSSKKHAEVAFRSYRLLTWFLSGCWESTIVKSCENCSSLYNHSYLTKAYVILLYLPKCLRHE